MEALTAATGTKGATQNHLSMARKRTASLLVATAVWLAAVPAASAAAASPGCRSEVVSIKTFHIEVGKLRPAYRVGETVKIPIVVTRPAREDPAGRGVPIDPPASEPAAGVLVLGVARIGDGLLYDTATTGADGKALLRVRIADTPRGTADLEIEAKKIVVETACATVQEDATLEIEDSFRVR